MLENKFKQKLIKELYNMFPGCLILHTDPTEIQGIPDLVIFYKDRYAFLECKKSKDSDRRPNQEIWVHHLNKMSFARFIYPENKEDVLYDLQEAFRY